MSRRRPLLELAAVILAVAAALGIELLLRFRFGISLPVEARTLPALLSGAVLAGWIAWRRGDAIQAFGLYRPSSVVRTLLWALAILVIFILAQNLVAIAGAMWNLPPPDYSRYDYLVGNWPAAFGLWLILIFTAAVPEEVLFRGFILGRLSEVIGGPAAIWFAALGQALVFGVCHYQWGLGGIAMTTVMGLVWGLGFILSSRNLWALIIAHSVSHLFLVVQLALS